MRGSLGEPLAGCLTRYAERDADLSPRPAISACPRNQLTNTSLACAHIVDGLCKGGAEGIIVELAEQIG